MKRSRNNERDEEPWSDKRQKTENNRQTSSSSVGQNSRQIGFGHLVHPHDFSSDVLPSNLNVWSNFCIHSAMNKESPWNRLEDNRGQTRPDAFFAVVDRLVKAYNDFPRNDTSKNHNDKLSKDIWTHFIQCQQPAAMYRQKIELWVELDRVLGPILECTTHAFGSTLNGFGSNESDLDLCLFFNSFATTDKEKNKADLDVLSLARNALRKHCGGFLSREMELIPAKVPILKLFDHFGHLEVDLSCNNPLSINNTHLLFCYSQLDWRVQPIVITLKSWAKKADINDAKNQTLSSYTMTLMIVHFLQAGVQPPVLPSLQILYPSTFGTFASPAHLSFLENLPKFESKNKMSLGELLVAFFDYYNNEFDFTRDAGSVRKGARVPLSECHEFARQNQLGPRQWEAYICMEEPFDRTNAGRAIVRRERFDEILSAFKAADKIMRKGGSLTKLLNRSSQ